MKKIIRRGVFETNSSSAHSISLAREDQEFVLDTIYPDQDGVVTLFRGKFGWYWLKINDAPTKASYVVTDRGLTDNLEEVIMEVTGATKVKVVGDTTHGYVDHQSQGTSPTSKEELKNFIFNKNSWLFTGNDNSEPIPTFYHVPEYKGGKMIQPRYKYNLSIPELKVSTMFLKKPTEEEIRGGIRSLLSNITIFKRGFSKDNSVFAQLYRNEEIYSLNYQIPINHVENTIYLTKDNLYSEEQCFIDSEEKRLNKKLNWTDRIELINQFYQQNPQYVRKINFIVEEIS